MQKSKYNTSNTSRSSSLAENLSKKALQLEKYDIPIVMPPGAPQEYEYVVRSQLTCSLTSFSKNCKGHGCRSRFGILLSACTSVPCKQILQLLPSFAKLVYCLMEAWKRPHRVPVSMATNGFEMAVWVPLPELHLLWLISPGPRCVLSNLNSSSVILVLAHEWPLFVCGALFNQCTLAKYFTGTLVLRLFLQIPPPHRPMSVSLRRF